MTEFKYIVLDESGRLRIEGTSLGIIEIVMACQAYGWSPEEYHLQHPDISLAQIHAALAYYYEHQIELDQVIREELLWAESERDQNIRETASIRERLRQLRQKSA